MAYDCFETHGSTDHPLQATKFLALWSTYVNGRVACRVKQSRIYYSMCIFDTELFGGRDREVHVADTQIAVIAIVIVIVVWPARERYKSRSRRQPGQSVH